MCLFLMCFSTILTQVTTYSSSANMMIFFWVVYCAQAFQEMQVAKITQIVKLCNLKSL